MQIYPNSIGKLAPDGSIEVEAVVSALTGNSMAEQHATMQMLGASPYFVRVESQRASLLTDDAQAELLASVQPSKTLKSNKAADTAAAKENT